MRNHRVMLGVRIFFNFEIFLHCAARIGKKRPLCANRSTKLLQRVMVVCRDRYDLRIPNSDLRIESCKIQMLLVLLRTVVATRQCEDHWIAVLQLTELARRVRMVGKLVVRKYASRYDVRAHAINSFDSILAANTNDELQIDLDLCNRS